MALKKIAELQTAQLPPLKIYIDDIQSLAHEISELGFVLKSITANGFEAQIVDDLRGIKPQKIKEFQLIAWDPRLTISLSEDGPNRIYVHDDSPKSKAAFLALISTLEKHQIKSVWFFAPHMAVFLGVLLIGLQGYFSPFNSVLLSALLGVAIAGLFFFALSIAKRVKRSQLFVSDRVPERNFWERNKDQILTKILVSSVAGAAGVLGTLALQYFLKSD